MVNFNTTNSSTNPANTERDTTRVNQQINSSTVRLIDAAGEMVGVVPLKVALAKAMEAGLDLIEVSPNASPPVCKILDYGKYKYEAQKRRNEAKKKQKVIEIKEIKIRPGIDDHDYDVKLKSIVRFLDEGDKVRVTLRFRGREMMHHDLGMQLLERMRTDLGDKAKIEQSPRLEGRQMVMALAPNKS
ncbi:MAG: translation initiation factor IF-3 [Rhodospirillaceae bacterium]|nr:translation initiation factor IF-3 [Rhodospirillaceae bacterium]